MSQDIYGLLKHYRDGLSWYDEDKKETYMVLGTRDVQDMLERHWREHIAKEIEALFCNGSNGCYGVNKEHCDVVKECADIARGQK
jgi:hypothetical protein